MRRRLPADGRKGDDAHPCVAVPTNVSVTVGVQVLERSGVALPKGSVRGRAEQTNPLADARGFTGWFA